MIAVLIEHDRGVLNRVSLEALTLARQIGEFTAIVIGNDDVDLTSTLGEYGASSVHKLKNAALLDYSPEAWAASLEQLIDELQLPNLIAAGSEKGNEVMAHLGARMELPMVSNCLHFEFTNDQIKYTRIRWGGSLLEDGTLNSSINLLTIAPHRIEPQSAEPSDLQIIDHEVDLPGDVFRVSIVDRILPQTDRISLTDAKVIVSGGRGVGSAEGFAVLEECAEVLNGAVGCSRAVTNNGWRPHSDQVGQTGARVAPELYIACGISGAIQHLVGCMGAKKILAINTDKDAPIVAKADYAIIDDLHKVLPKITEALK